LAFCLVGLLLTVRKPDNPIGWGFAAAGWFAQLQAASIAWADAGLRPHGTHLPAAALAGNLTQWIFAPGVTLGYTLPFLWFPDGRLLSSRWRPVVRVALAATVLMCAVNIVAPGPLNNYAHVRNPLGVDVPGASLVDVLGMLSYVGALIVAAASVLIRFRRSSGIERLQMRWFLVGVAGSVVAFVAAVVLTLATGDIGPATLLLWALPVCAGVAILRYRLFDIDRVISRTVTYTAVTALVVAPYVALVLVAGDLGSGSGVTVAAATLFALAALRPVRRRVQARVDRRFNRERYDSARTIDAFAVRLRDAVDAAVVRDDLLDVTARVMQPTTVSLWTASARGTAR
jgi:hypothetical protein